MIIISGTAGGGGALMAEEWTDDAAAAISLCQDWAAKVRADVPCEVYLFGSAIYDGGDQFDPEYSDLDLVVALEQQGDAASRATIIEKLQRHKLSLELEMVPALHRTNCVEPGVSVVVLTPYELTANVHKSGARRFFDKNFFLDLGSGDLKPGLAGAGIASIPDEVRQAIEYTQKLRNDFLAIAANGMGGVARFDGRDPIPKALARAAAQLDDTAQPGEWYDTRRGLELVFNTLGARRAELPDLDPLFRKVSKRRGGKGQDRILTPEDQLRLGELLFDLAANAPLAPLTSWEIRFEGADYNNQERERLLGEIRRLAPDAQLVDIYRGSIVMRFVSSQRSYDTLHRLHGLQVLPTFFGVEAVKLSAAEGLGASRRSHSESLIDQLVVALEQWQPKPFTAEHALEVDLMLWIADWLSNNPDLTRGDVSREPSIVGHPTNARADLLISARSQEGDENILVELTRVRRPRSFLLAAERMLYSRGPALIVAYGTSGELDRIREDAEGVRTINPQLRVAFVTGEPKQPR